jgi:hypothetical protein
MLPIIGEVFPHKVRTAARAYDVTEGGRGEEGKKGRR